MTTLRRTQLSILITGLIFVGAVASVVFIQYERLHELRDKIDTTRAATAGIAIEQQNLEDLQKQQATLSAAVSALQKEVWLFQDEDTFYSTIQSIAVQTKTTIAEPKLSDAIPNTNYQVRTGTLNIAGSTADILKAMDAIAAVQPLIAMQQVTLTGGATPQATVTIQTTWQ